MNPRLCAKHSARDGGCSWARSSSKTLRMARSYCWAVSIIRAVRTSTSSPTSPSSEAATVGTTLDSRERRPSDESARSPRCERMSGSERPELSARAFSARGRAAAWALARESRSRSAIDVDAKALSTALPIDQSRVFEHPVELDRRRRGVRHALATR